MEPSAAWEEQEQPGYWEHNTKRAKSTEQTFLVDQRTLFGYYDQPCVGSRAFWTSTWFPAQHGPQHLSPSLLLSFSPGHPALFSHLSFQLLGVHFFFHFLLGI